MHGERGDTSTPPDRMLKAQASSFSVRSFKARELMAICTQCLPSMLRMRSGIPPLAPVAFQLDLLTQRLFSLGVGPGIGAGGSFSFILHDITEQEVSAGSKNTEGRVEGVLFLRRQEFIF